VCLLRGTNWVLNYIYHSGSIQSADISTDLHTEEEPCATARQLPLCTRLYPLFHIQYRLQQNVRSSITKLRRLILLDTSLFTECSGTVTNLWTGRSTVRFLARRRTLSRPYQLWGPCSSVSNGYPSISFPGVKWPQPEPDHSPQPKVEFLNYSS